LEVFDSDGAGPLGERLFVGGSFREGQLGVWDGSAWTHYEGTQGVQDLLVTDIDGSGPALYAMAFYLERFIGTGFWRMSDRVSTSGRLAVWDGDGAGPDHPALYANGNFAFGFPDPFPQAVVRWNGSALVGDPPAIAAEIASGAGLGLDSAVDGIPAGLYIGASVILDDGSVSAGISRWGVEVSCPADCDRDGELTFFDFLCFQNAFSAGDPAADCDGDTELTFFDFLCFQNQFSAGCP
jgi:hypothetical protein